MSFVILCSRIYRLLLRSQRQLRFAKQNSLNLLFLGICLISDGITRATITPKIGVGFFDITVAFDICETLRSGVLFLLISCATTLACHTGQLKSLMPSYLSCYEFFSTKKIWLVSFATSAFAVLLNVRLCD